MASLANWKPTENMIAVLKLAQDSDYEMSVTAICKAAGIARMSWYDYWATAPFVQWWTQAFEKHFAGRLPHVYAALDQAARGNRPAVSTSAAKLLMERFDEGYAPKTRADVKVDSTQKTYVNVDVKRVTGENILPEAGSDPPGAPKRAAGTPAAPEGE